MHFVRRSNRTPSGSAGPSYRSRKTTGRFPARRDSRFCLCLSETRDYRTINRAVLATFAISAVCRAATLHVPADYPTIQSCIDAAVSGVDECNVAPGTYHETINFLGKAITVRSSGGADVTTIDATGVGGSVVSCRSHEGPDSVLDGFTITGGTGTDLGGFTSGGGMYNNYSSPTVTDCKFSGNTGRFGGAMSNYYGSPTVTNCTFSGNTATYYGGGMYNYSGSPTVADCTVSGNTASAGGGGMYNYYGSPTVSRCTFTGNTGYDGGGIYTNSSSPTVTNCTFSGNIANSGKGGGMYNGGGSPTRLSRL